MPSYEDDHRFTERSHDLVRFGAQVRQLRLRARLRQADLAGRAGLDRIAISNIERGVREVGVTRALAIARALGVPAGELFTEVPPVEDFDHGNG